jgi:hypothetical protein
LAAEERRKQESITRKEKQAVEREKGILIRRVMLLLIYPTDKRQNAWRQKSVENRRPRRRRPKQKRTASLLRNEHRHL